MTTSSPWNPDLLFRDVEPDRALAAESVEAVLGAVDQLNLPAGTSLILVDLNNGRQTRYVTWPVVLHRCGQDCGRA